MANRGVNRVIIIGNLGDDPKSNPLPSGGTAVSLSVATSESWKDKQTGEMKDRTEWHRVSAFGKLAEIMEAYLTKGSKVYIEGKLRTRKYQAQDGTDRYTTEIIADQMQMLDSRNDGSNGGSGAQNQYQAPQQQAQQGGGADFDDDIPFMRYQPNMVI